MNVQLLQEDSFSILYQHGPSFQGEQLPPESDRYTRQFPRRLLVVIVLTDSGLCRKGHVDFSWEVSRSLAACQGAILLVDASQGIQAQTMSVFHIAKEKGLKIIPILNKVQHARIVVTEADKRFAD